MKQQNLKQNRNYLENPRRSTEFDPEFRSDVDYFDESKTKQSDAESADINVIMKRYEKTGQLPEMIRGEPSYGDFSDAGSFHEALNIVQFANSQFMALDAHIRARFNNDPGQFLEFANDPKNLPEMVHLGLAEERDPTISERNNALRARAAASAASKQKKGAGGTPPVSDDSEGD